MDTLNHAYDVESSRSYVRTHALAVAIMIGNVLLFVGAAGSLLVGPAIIDTIGLGPAGRLFWTIVQWPIAFLFMVAAFWVAYYFLPNRDQSSCKMLLVKVSAIAAAVWVLATAAFRVYIANFSSYSETYGFLGAFIILLLWLYVTGLVVLAGGELASEMERRA
jgi:membrane protein